MELPKFVKSGGGGFEGLKTKLGFPSAPKPDDYDEGYYEDPEGGSGEYADYGEGYEGDYDEHASADPPGTPGAPVATAEGTSSPRLVSIDDVRTSTQYTEQANRRPYSERRPAYSQGSASYPSASTSAQRNAPSLVRSSERAQDYLRSTETSDLPYHVVSREAGRPSGYNALFSPTAAPGGATATATPAAVPAVAFDPHEVSDHGGMSSPNPLRGVSVLRPASYSEVERIARTVRAGDALVLSLRNTPEQLAKRVLDFSFGVSSALDATVDCIADKVFVIVRGRELSKEEYLSLRAQGVIE
ncbi:MAG: cell division protein SepF [Eggerthellaceae bacterium]|nr:cell division protein SepF [Eggerthellaceae bacterium]